MRFLLLTVTLGCNLEAASKFMCDSGQTADFNCNLNYYNIQINASYINKLTSNAIRIYYTENRFSILSVTKI